MTAAAQISRSKAARDGRLGDVAEWRLTPGMAEYKRALDLALLGLALAGLIGGLAARSLNQDAWAVWIFLAGSGPVLLAVLADSVASLVRREVGLDIIALLSIAGALLLQEYVAAAVVGLMLSGGRALEDFADARARREMSALLSRVPRTASRYDDGQIASVPLDAVRVGDRLLVRAGEAVPVDGCLAAGTAVLDEAALTGEPLPATRLQGERLRSGSVNAGGPFDLIATATAADSTFAAIVQLVRQAQEAKAPSARLADRAAFVFTPLTIALAGAAWAWSNDPVRGLAVLVVATPCPLILAVPVAIVSGLSRCAGRGVLVKGGGALEQLARLRTLFLDKTGTLTDGRARVAAIETEAEVGSDEALRLAASLDQLSQHVIADAIVGAARARGLPLALPTHVEEEAGAGLTGILDDRRISVGSYAYVSARAQQSDWSRRFLQRMGYEGATGAFVAADGRMLGAIQLADEIRPDSARALRLLRRAGIKRTIMLTGDRRDVAERIGAALGVDEVRAELQPQDKLAAIAEVKAQGVCAMVGDGVNDAPALAAADVGIAMGARGSGASSEAASVVLLVDRLDRLADALAIAQGARRIALQSVWIGMGLSIVAMVAAALGFLPPVAGALLQEAIDVAAILNALRVLRVRVPGHPRVSLPVAEVARLREEHERLTGPLARVRAVADQLSTLAPAEAIAALGEVENLVREQLLRHEQEDDAQLYPRIEQALGGDDPIAAMHRTHREVQELGILLSRMVADLAPGSLDPTTMNEFRRVLYGLDAILRLHFAQENELYHGLAASRAHPSERHAAPA